MQGRNVFRWEKLIFYLIIYIFILSNNESGILLVFFVKIRVSVYGQQYCFLFCLQVHPTFSSYFKKGQKITIEGGEGIIFH